MTREPKLLSCNALLWRSQIAICQPQKAMYISAFHNSSLGCDQVDSQTSVHWGNFLYSSALWTAFDWGCLVPKKKTTTGLHKAPAENHTRQCIGSPPVPCTWTNPVAMERYNETAWARKPWQRWGEGGEAVLIRDSPKNKKSRMTTSGDSQTDGGNSL